MVATYGKRVNGRLIPLSKQTLALEASVPGRIYELLLETEGIQDPQSIINILLQELPKKEPTAKILWIESDNKNIRVQIAGSPFLWTIFLAFLPQILALAGVALIIATVFNVVATVPTWVWYLLFGGVTLFLIARYIIPTIEVEEY